MKIKCAAIRYGDDVYEGRSHSEIGIKMVDDGVCGETYPCGEDQGFVTSDGKYVNRVDALAIAIEAGQVDESKVRANRLFSEDLIDIQKITMNHDDSTIWEEEDKLFIDKITKILNEDNNA